ncbi:MAG TPA: lysyl oxidase family protein, partial [Candidatus Limnocylindrales bacterium]|nr:lysyl oxidase family protein [Candidatus Limnocylindrales bacterium]
MGVNLVTRVRDFTIQNRSFASGDHDVQDGCVTPGAHKVLRFDFLSYNAGSSDMVIGSPASRPDLFVWSSGHGHYHLKDFNEFLLFTAGGSLATIGYKQAFCAIDIERISPTASATPRFGGCNSDQGISAGWADVYSAFLACQFVVIDGLPDGDYTLQSTTNAKHVAGEECYGDNTIWTGLRIAGNTVQQIDPPFIPADCIPFNRANVAAAQVGGRWKVVEGGSHWMLDTGSSQWEAQRAVEIINHYKLARMCFVGRPRCGSINPMMYWLNDRGRAPTGQLPGEDCIAFDRDHLAVVEIGGRWKVVEGTHWLLDFGPGEGNARAALHFIRKHRFDQVCYVGRPDPSMTYFKTRGRPIVDVFDPRRIEAAIESPTWWREQLGAVADRAPSVDLGAECAGRGTNPRDVSGFVFEVGRADVSEIVDLHGVTGLALGKSAEVRLPQPAEVVDVGLAHDGTPPKVVAYAGKRAVARAAAGASARHIENIRLVGS